MGKSSQTYKLSLCHCLTQCGYEAGFTWNPFGPSETGHKDVNVAPIRLSPQSYSEPLTAVNHGCGSFYTSPLPFAGNHPLCLSLRFTPALRMAAGRTNGLLASCVIGRQYTNIADINNVNIVLEHWGKYAIVYNSRFRAGPEMTREVGQGDPELTRFGLLQNSVLGQGMGCFKYHLRNGNLPAHLPQGSQFGHAGRKVPNSTQAMPNLSPKHPQPPFHHG